MYYIFFIYFVILLNSSDPSLTGHMNFYEYYNYFFYILSSYLAHLIQIGGSHDFLSSTLLLLSIKENKSIYKLHILDKLCCFAIYSTIKIFLKFNRFLITIMRCPNNSKCEKHFTILHVDK